MIQSKIHSILELEDLTYWKIDSQILASTFATHCMPSDYWQ